MSELRQRGPKKPVAAKSEKGPSPGDSPKQSKKHKVVSDAGTERKYQLVNAVLTVLAFATRFYLINYPSEVVFDEVHFGKFASYYLERTYFFDLHPPFAKLLIAAVGWLVGYDGQFKFDSIGDSYITNEVPFVAYRSLSATLGALTVPVVFQILKESGYSVHACMIGASLILFDNAHIAETRLILLDATLIFSVALSIYSYVRFSKLRSKAFSCQWWKWLCLTGVSLSCVISTKYVGVFTFVTIGAAVLIDLWHLLDYRAGLSMSQFYKQFFARAFGLIIVPLGIFLFWFWVHFTVLIRSGPGDAFMSPEFQETLGDNLMAKEARQINYYDIVTLRHMETKGLLHSHLARYPLRYDDGRISSQGQQVTGYEFEDENNNWQILPAVDFPEDSRVGHPIFGEANVRLRHVSTDTILLTHDVASPYYPTNEEFTTVPMEEALDSRYNDTLFTVRLKGGAKDMLKTKASYFKFIHVQTKVAMWSDFRRLPEWGFQQFEVNGNKNIADNSNSWYFDEIVGLSDPARLNFEPKERAHMNFFKKYFELQLTMFAQNNALTSSHPYASEPITWPFLVRGVSFWTNDDNREQIYFIGNFLGWWFEISMIAIYAGVLVADQLCLRRNMDPLSRVARSKLYNSMGYFCIAWASHYWPFFLMGRQKFLHHYLPAHLLAALLAAALLDFATGELDDDALQAKAAGKKWNNWKLSIVSAIILVAIMACFAWLAPLTYGSPSLTVEQVQQRELMKIDLHFSK
jgi:dolichyl-phosphate-mannose-protein mannosyltransferase